MAATGIDGVVDVLRFGKGGDDPPDLVIEIPHGATRTADFTALAARLSSPLPDGLVDFFHVNTDAGAPELGEAIARALDVRVVLLRCRVPRTFIDCNRVIDAAPEDFKAGKVTPGLMPWITDAADRALLRGLYDRYVATVDAHARAAGAMLLLHTYAPRTVGVEVDLDIVTNLRRAYLPDVDPTWPLRPEVDVIGAPEHAPAAVVEELRRRLPFPVAESATYPMHPSTLAWRHVERLPGRVICLEVRRDLLADPFTPFAEMHISPVKVAELATPIAHALRRFW